MTPPRIELTMHTKIHINISQDSVYAEGDPELVREVYADLKDRMLAEMNILFRSAVAEEVSDEPPVRVSRT